MIPVVPIAIGSLVSREKREDFVNFYTFGFSSLPNYDILPTHPDVSRFLQCELFSLYSFKKLYFYFYKDFWEREIKILAKKHTYLVITIFRQSLYHQWFI